MKITLVAAAVLAMTCPAVGDEKLMIVAGAASESLGVQHEPARSFWTIADELKAGQEQIYSAACCKVCRKGKACGDSCISRSYQCHKGRGCACDG